MVTLNEIVAALSELAAERVFHKIVTRLDDATIRYAVVGDFPVISARFEIAVERASREQAITILESFGFSSVANQPHRSRYKRAIAEVQVHYVDREILARESDLAWCSYLTKDEPPSREITPPDAEPFVL